MTSATSPIRPPGASIGKLYETSKLDRFWLEFSALIPWLGGAESDEGLEVFGRPEGVYILKRSAGGGHLPQGWDQPGDVLQLEAEVRRAAADRCGASSSSKRRTAS